MINRGQNTPNDSNIDWGSRYLSSLLIFVAILLGPMVSFLQNKWGRFAKACIILIVLWSGLVTTAYTALSYKVYTTSSDTREFFQKGSGDVWVFTNNNLLHLASLELFRRPVLLVDSRSDLESIKNHICSGQGVQSLTIFSFKNDITLNPTLDGSGELLGHAIADDLMQAVDECMNHIDSVDSQLIQASHYQSRKVHSDRN